MPVHPLIRMSRFLLPALHIEAVLDKPTVRKRRQALKDMPRALHDAFGATIERIQSQKPDTAKQAMEVLKWIFLGNSENFTVELRHALAVEPGDRNLDWDNLVDPKFLIDCCLGLVIVDESSSTVRLVHKSLQDHFEIQYAGGQLFENGNSETGYTCLNYMSFSSYNHEVKDLYTEIFDKYTLLLYATGNWLYHIRNGHRDTSPNQKTSEEKAVSLLQERYDPSIVLETFLSFIWRRYFYRDFYHRGPGEPRTSHEPRYYGLCDDYTYILNFNKLLQRRLESAVAEYSHPCRCQCGSHKRFSLAYRICGHGHQSTR